VDHCIVQIFVNLKRKLEKFNLRSTTNFEKGQRKAWRIPLPGDLDF
jgi:hypothetical protein